MQQYTINNTSGVLKFILVPGASNGPGLVQVDSDLRTYGAGHRQWGEGVNENFYRLTENFACDETAPGSKRPKNAVDLGIPGAGINEPLNGQLWFNTSSSKLFVYNQGTDTWKGLGGVEPSATPPSNPSIGDLWYDSTDDKLYTWNGTAWVAIGYNETEADARFVNSAGDTMTGQLVLAGNPINNLDATPKQYVDTAVSAVATNVGTNFYDKTASDARFVNVTGDLMTGALQTSVYSNMFVTISAHNPTTPAISLGSSTAATTVPVISFHSSGTSSVLNHRDAMIHVTGGNISTPDQGVMTLYGNVQTDGRTPTQPNEVVTKNYVDTGFYKPSPFSSTNHTITISTGAPSGGVPGDIWLKI